MTSNRSIFGVALIAVASWSTAAVAEDVQTRAWASACATCHGTTGNAVTGIPPIAGQNAQHLFNALKEFKDDKRPGATVMHQLAKGYTDDELQRLANFFAQQQP